MSVNAPSAPASPAGTCWRSWWPSSARSSRSTSPWPILPIPAGAACWPKNTYVASQDFNKNADRARRMGSRRASRVRFTLDGGEIRYRLAGAGRHRSRGRSRRGDVSSPGRRQAGFLDQADRGRRRVHAPRGSSRRATGSSISPRCGTARSSSTRPSGSSRRAVDMSCCAPGTEGALDDGMQFAEELWLASRDLGNGCRQLELSVPAVYCGACITKIEGALRSAAGGRKGARQSVDQAVSRSPFATTSTAGAPIRPPSSRRSPRTAIRPICSRMAPRRTTRCATSC